MSTSQLFSELNFISNSLHNFSYLKILLRQNAMKCIPHSATQSAGIQEGCIQLWNSTLSTTGMASLHYILVCPSTTREGSRALHCALSIPHG